MKNVLTDQGLKNSLVLQGDVINYWKSSKQAVEVISRSGMQNLILNESSKNSIKLQVRFPNPDWLLVGMRVKFDTSGKSPSKVSFRAFNRRIPAKDN